MVVILGLAADVYEAIDRGRAADHPAARVVNRASVGAGVRLGPKLPRQGIVVEHLEEPGRDVDQRVPVAASKAARAIANGSGVHAPDRHSGNEAVGHVPGNRQPWLTMAYRLTDCVLGI